MASIWEELGIDPDISIKEKERNEKELKEIRRTILQGSGIKPDSLKMYNLYIKQSEGEPVTAREYSSDESIRLEVENFIFLLHCTQYFFQDIFETNLDDKELAKLASSEYERYYFHGTDLIKNNISRYERALGAIKAAPNITGAKLKATLETLEKLDLNIPRELTLVQYFHDNYKSNQRRKAVIDAVMKIFPQISDKIILEKIATNALI